MTKPDFIIIGAMKSATSTVHEQLARQPGIFMTTPKEPNFFSDDDVYALGNSWYDALFETALPTDMCGESSTHYTKLPDYPLTVARMKERLISPRLIYIMRHPIDRLISHYIHQWSQNVIKCDINRAIDLYPELIEYSCYGKQLKPYFEQYGESAVLPLFTESIKKSPQEQLDKIAEFLGYEGTMQWLDIQPQNVSRERIRPFWGYRWLIESRWMTQLRRNLIPKSFRERVKKSFTLQERPDLSEANLLKIKTIIDDDLRVLNKWLGFALTCDSYHKAMAEHNLKASNRVNRHDIRN